MCRPYDVTPSRQIVYLSFNFDDGTRSTALSLCRQLANYTREKKFLENLISSRDGAEKSTETRQR